MKILAVDDQQLVLMPLEKRLKELGYTVQTTTDANSALAIYKSFQPDLLIIDLNMPGTSGMEIIKHIREHITTSKPIIVLSGNTDDKLIVEGFELGIQDFMKKPLSLDEISARVKAPCG